MLGSVKQVLKVGRRRRKMLKFCEESLEIGMLECWRLIESWSLSARVGFERGVLE